MEVFAAVVRWVDHDRHARAAMTCALMQHVRLQLIPPDVLATKVEGIEHVFDVLECQIHLSEAYK